ncbi:glycosyltransferase, partial [Candidatus Pelagibacter sp.]|nr:glycosyltransferase [Candidatus Pelagibacter sp.]
MKILYISNSIIPSRTANSIHVMKMCQAFADNGHEVVLLAPANNSKYEKNVQDIFEFYGVRKNFKIKKLWYPDIKIGTLFYSLSIFFFLLFKRNFDLVYGRFLHGCYLAALFKKDIVFESHAPIYEEHKLTRKIFSFLVKKINFKKLVVISEALKKMYLQNTTLVPNKIDVIHDGADEVKDLNNKVVLLGNSNNLKVGYVGHLYKGKGIEIIESISDKVSKDIDFHIIGGLEADIQMWKEKIKSKNVFFYGYVPHKEVSSYINSLDICMLPNQKVVLAHGAVGGGINISGYTSPLKLFEYMSHKKAIISSDLPVLREVLDTSNSFLVEHDNSYEWVKAIEKLKNHYEREKIANKASSDFLSYTWKNRAKNIVSNLSNRKITILISSLSGGGAEGVSVNIANSFANDGWEVDLVVLHLKNATYLDRVSNKVNLVVLNVNNARYSAWPLLKYIRRKGPDIIFVFNYELAALLVIVRNLLRFKTKIIARNMNTFTKVSNIAKEKNLWIRVVVRFLIDKFYSKADHIVNQSHAMREDLISVHPQLKHNSSVIYNPVAKHIEDYANSNDLNNIKKKDYLLCVGRLEKQKAFHYAIKGFAGIANKFPNLRLKIVGKGSLEKELRQNAIDFGVEDRVDFEGFQKHMIPYYLYAKATLLTSLYEGYPNVLVESITLKTPVVAFDCPSGPSEIIKDKINGYLVKYQDVDELMKKLVLVLSKSAL